MQRIRFGNPGSRLSATSRAGLACLASSAVLAAATTFISPVATASEATNVVVRTVSQDGLGKRNGLQDLDMLVQDEALLRDGTTWSDADPASLTTTPIDEVAVKLGFPKIHDVKQAGIPTFLEGETAQFRIRVYPRFLGVKADGSTYLSNSDVTVSAVTDNPATPAAGCDITNPVRVDYEGSLEYQCTVPNVQARGDGTAEDLIHTITASRVALEDVTHTVATASESAAINVVRPCISVKKYVRAAGSSDTWEDAQTPAETARVASGTDAEYQIVVTNCGETDLANVKVTDTISGCDRTIDGILGIGASATYGTVTPGSEACRSNGVTELIPSTATATGVATLNGRTGKAVTSSDPAHVTAKATVVPTTATPTTVAPTTLAPTTEAPTTQAPTTLAPTTLAPTTEAPTTQAPTTLAPTTLAPTTLAPTTQAPTTVTTTVATTVATTIAPSGCVGIKKYVRQAGTNGVWLDAQDPANAAFIAYGAEAEYRIVVNNCANSTLTNVVVTDTIKECGRTIGTLAIGGSYEYTTSTTGSGDCHTKPVTAALCSTATVTAQPVNGAMQAFGSVLTVSDPACIVTSPAPTTVAPTTVAPTTVAPTTAAPTTAVVQVLDNTVAVVSEPTEELGVTGSSTRPMLTASAALALLGAALMLGGRRPRRHQALHS